MRVLRLLFLPVLILLVSMMVVPSAGHAAGPAPVLVYYYAWWAPDAVGPGKSPDWPVNPYHSWDTAVIQKHVSQIASAGIDGIVVAWYGPQEAYNQTETNFRMILDQASAYGTHALLSVDLGNSAWFKDTQEVVDGLNYALNVHAQHPAYFRYNDHPVLLFWFQGRYSLSEWAVIRQQVDPDHQSVWIAEGAAPGALPTFDGLHMYTIAWSNNVYVTLSQWGNTAHTRGGIWVATAMPGWDNTYTQQSEKYVRYRSDGAFYRETFSAAAASSPEMILITSWNEWWEGTHIEPSHNYGDFYLNLTRDLIGEYKGSGAVAGGGGVSLPVQPSSPPTLSQPTSEPPAARPQPQATTLASGSEIPTRPIDPTSTPSNIPTATPPPLRPLTATPAPLNLPTSVAAVGGASGSDSGWTQPSGGGLRQALESPTQGPVLLGGVVAGGIGLLLLGGFGWWYLHKHRSDT